MAAPPTTATELSPEIWNAISRMVQQSVPGREITFGKVVKRDSSKKLVWLEEFGQTAIPLLSFDYHFEYYDSLADGTVAKRSSPEGKNPAFRTKIITPQIGQMVAVLKPWGGLRFPMCVGVIQSTGHWSGEV